jgi:hypothetical protein
MLFPPNTTSIHTIFLKTLPIENKLPIKQIKSVEKPENSSLKSSLNK